MLLNFLNYLGEVIVNGNPPSKGGDPEYKILCPSLFENVKLQRSHPRTRDMLLSQGAEKFSQWLRDHRPLMVTDTTLKGCSSVINGSRGCGLTTCLR